MSHDSRQALRERAQQIQRKQRQDPTTREASSLPFASEPSPAPAGASRWPLGREGK